MSKTIDAPAAAAGGPFRRPRAREAGPAWKALMALASLRLTVVLFALAFVLVFLGTLAQVDEGIFTVLHKYFRTGIAWIPLQALHRFGEVFFGLPQQSVGGSFPYPGGWLLGSLLLVNLLAAHIVRFKFAWKRSGILILHAGLVILMLGELVTGVFAVEGRMTIEQNGTSNYVEDHNSFELAIIDRYSDPKVDQVVVVPASKLKKEGDVIRHPDLPFDIQVVQYLPNSTAPDVRSGLPNPATAGDGLKEAVEPRKESGGVGSETDLASAYLTFRKKDADPAEGDLGTYLVSAWWSDFWLAGLDERPQKVKVGDKTYEVFLRFKRTYKPYSVHLIEFHHGVYPGTDIPKDYTSRVVLTDPAAGERREVEISMNEPMLYGWETFYQSSFLPGDKGTVLQVVRNPGKRLPYIACTMVAGGMLLHFGLVLAEFLRKRAAS
jgi:ResB-like family